MYEEPHRLVREERTVLKVCSERETSCGSKHVKYRKFTDTQIIVLGLLKHEY
jgi:hypothetical protein